MAQFDKFVRDNDQKRGKALKKAADEVEARKQKTEEVAKAKATLAELKEKKAQSSVLLDRDEQYYKYFSRVCEYDKTSDWQSNEAVINRYEVLKAANTDLYNKAVSNDREIEQIRRQLAEFTKGRTTAILNLTNQLALARTQLEEATRQSVEMETAGFEVEGSSNDVTRVLGEVKMAISNIYVKCKKPRDPLMGPGTPLLRLLEYIQERISDLSAITAIHAAQEQADAKAAAAAAGGSGLLQQEQQQLGPGNIVIVAERPQPREQANYQSNKGAVHLGGQPPMA